MKNQEYVQTEEALGSVVDYFGKQKMIAVDTEFHRERSYFPQIALLQISDGERTCCIDPLAIADLSPIGDILTSHEVIKVIHSASQDLEVFANTLKLMPVSLFDTQIGAAFLGLGEQVSYAALVKHYCNTDLDKAHTRSNWLQRPLSVEQLDYAADDVLYLAKIYPLMLEELQIGRAHV